jgi:hypothetical protein
MPIKRHQRGRNHYYTIDGKKAIGVTTALSEGVPKPALPYWAAKVVAAQAVDMSGDEWLSLRNLGREAAIAALKQAPWTQRGTNVHTLAEKLITGEQVGVPEHLYGHVESVARFLDEWQVRPLLTEKVVGSYQWGYAGTFDLIAELSDGRRVLFDYKTSTGIYPETALQLAAYCWADVYLADDGTEIPLSEVGIDECKAVHVRADGYDVIPLNTSRRPVFETFLHALGVARGRADMDAWVGAAETPDEYATTIGAVA